MATAEQIAARALDLAREPTPADAGVAELLRTAADRRVALVRAKQQILADMDGDPVAGRAVQLIEQTLDAGSWDIA